MPAGLAEAMVPFTQGYLKEEEAGRGREAAAVEAQAVSTERTETSDARRMKMDQMKETMRRENFKEALQHMMVGDFGAAESAYGKSGKRKMEKGSARAEQDEEGNTFFTWNDEESGEQVVTEMKYAMMMAGLRPGDSEMPGEKHKRDLELQAAKSKGKAGSTNLIKNVEYFMGSMQGRDGKPITKQELFTRLTGSKKSREGMAIQLRGQILKRASDEGRSVSTEDLNTEVKEAMDFIGKFGEQQGAMAEPGATTPPVNAEVAELQEMARKKNELIAKEKSATEGQAMADFSDPETHDN